MKTLDVEGNLAKKEASKTKPILVQKSPYLKKSEKYELYKKKIENQKYLEFAIDEIALELTHYLSKQ
ncbi:MAG: hypothetical protein H7A23_12740 [Leptospiraceae bacterium]|nr:hypothetical protein [Leptospiraceae bacterium]MCP5495417.1 hypothetical protein [Leptospiraceae bacterium]